jgi:DNA gyrase subunit B
MLKLGPVTTDEEHNLMEFAVTGPINGREVTRKISGELLATVEYRHLLALYSSVSGFESPPFLVYHKDKEHVLVSKAELLCFITALGREGLTVQRYKGLGEMNPEQLWETTMDPQTRHLLQVKVEDAVVADEIFTILMGDQVDERRKFIEHHALQVENLDV